MWVRCQDFEPLNLRDPFYAMIEDAPLLDGIEVFYAYEGATNLSWRMVLYRGHSLSKLHRFTQRPEMMKDIRLH